MAQQISICGNCQQEFPSVNIAVNAAMKKYGESGEITFSHGMCPRHFREQGKDFGWSNDRIENHIKGQTKTTPDLKEHPELIKQYSQGIFTPEQYKQNEFPTELKEMFQRRANILS